jgi:MipA family protein
MNRYLTRLLAITLFCFGINNLASAAPAPIITSTQIQNDKDHSLGIGYTMSVAKRPFIGVEDQTASLPYFSFARGDFYIEGLDIAYKIQKNHYWATSVIATPRFYEVKASFADNGELNGIEEKHPAYFGGVSTQLSTQFATYTFQLLGDLTESDGFEMVVQAGKSYQVSSQVTLIPSLGLSWQDKKLVSYYYGVQPDEVIAGRPAYDGDRSLNINATLNLIWNINNNFQLLGQLKYEALDAGITDSPIVDEDHVNFVTLGAVYRF